MTTPFPRIPCYCPECNSSSYCILDSMGDPRRLLYFTTTTCCDVKPRHSEDHSKPIDVIDFKRLLKSKQSEYLQK